MGRGRLAARDHGLALVAVLWMTAALSLLVGGLLSLARAEVKAAQVRGAAAEAIALGDAAIQLAVLDWRTATPPPDSLRRADYMLEGRVIAVRVVPATGYINLNAAPEPLLRALLTLGGGLDPAVAGVLAQHLIDWRDADDAALPEGAEAPAYAAANVAWRPRNGRLLVPEDLLQVLGFDFDLFERIRPYVTVWAGAAAGVNPLAAPPEVLAVLAGGNHALAGRIAAARDAGDRSMDLTALDPAFLDQGGVGSVLHVEAEVPVGELRALRGRWIVAAPDAGGAPWQTLTAEPVRFLPLPPPAAP